MAISAQDILDLNGSMEAARNYGAGLGTLVSQMSASVVTNTDGLAVVVAQNVVASGSITPTDGDREVVVTGLATVTFAVVSLSGSPSQYHQSSTITAGSVAGTLVIASWTADNVAITTPKSASAGWAKVEWLATGTA